MRWLTHCSGSYDDDHDDDEYDDEYGDPHPLSAQDQDAYDPLAS